MNEREHAQFCFRLLNEPCTTPRMVVNSGSTFLKRCQQAKEMHGHDTPPEVEPEGIPKEDATAVRHGLSGGPRSNCMGLAGHGHFKRAGSPANFLLEQMDNARNDAALMKRIRKGWQTYGTDPWWAVHDIRTPQIARYNSEPIMSVRSPLTPEVPL